MRVVLFDRHLDYLSNHKIQALLLCTNCFIVIDYTIFIQGLNGKIMI